MSSFGKFTFGILVGAAAGAVVGMLLAPRSGEETRRLIRDEMDRRVQESTDHVREVVEEKREVLREGAEALKERAMKITDDLEQVGRETVEKLTNRTKPSKA